MATAEDRTVILSIIKFRDIDFTSFTAETEAKQTPVQET